MSSAQPGDSAPRPDEAPATSPSEPTAAPNPTPPHPGPAYPSQPYAEQPYAGQPYPGQEYPSQAYPGQPGGYPGHPQQGQAPQGYPQQGYPQQPAYPPAGQAGYPYPPSSYGQQPPGYPAAYYPQQPYPAAAKPVQPERSPILGMVGLGVVAISLIASLIAVVPIGQFIVANMDLSAVPSDPETTARLAELMSQQLGLQAAVLNLAGFTGFAGWVTSIVATFTRRGRLWGIIGMVLGVLSPIILVIAMMAAMMPGIETMR